MRTKIYPLPFIALPAGALLFSLLIAVFSDSAGFFYLLCAGILVFSFIQFMVATRKPVSQPGRWNMAPVMPVRSAPLASAVPAGPAEVSTLASRAFTENRKMTELAERILGLMENDKLYQEAELTLPQIAEKLQVPVYQASLALNEGIGKKFYDLVNEYRVQEAKRLLSDPRNRNFTILSVGFEAGFNSKTTFNTVFKKFTGQTPTEYRDRTIPVSAAQAAERAVA